MEDDKVEIRQYLNALALSISSINEEKLNQFIAKADLQNKGNNWGSSGKRGLWISLLLELARDVEPTFTEMVSNREDIELIHLKDDWDFMVMRSRNDPTVGMAVSNRSGSCGKGNMITVVNESSQWDFICPCACCQWNASGERYDEKNLLVAACKSLGITHLILSNHETLKEYFWGYPWGMTFIDPFDEKVISLNGWGRYLNLFKGFKIFSD